MSKFQSTRCCRQVSRVPCLRIFFFYRSENSWEHVEALKCPELLKEFEERQRIERRRTKVMLKKIRRCTESIEYNTIHRSKRKIVSVKKEEEEGKKKDLP